MRWNIEQDENLCESEIFWQVCGVQTTAGWWDASVHRIEHWTLNIEHWIEHSTLNITHSTWSACKTMYKMKRDYSEELPKIDKISWKFNTCFRPMHTSTFHTKFITHFIKFPDSPYQVHFGGVPHPRLHCPLLLGHILMPSFCPRWHFYPSLCAPELGSQTITITIVLLAYIAFIAFIASWMTFCTPSAKEVGWNALGWNVG